tara:strand:+ start:785 stop:1300 length:516 start_codon:yes stop_codon:yes gene_type:complete
MVKNMMAYEESSYQVIKKFENFEIRSYQERYVIQVRYNNDDGGFQRLFNYISGKNQKSEKIEMTTPVTQYASGNQKIMQFYLPGRFDQKNAPIPLNKSVEVASIKAGYFAVIRYSGFASDKNFLKHASVLKKSLEKEKIEFIEPPIKATYNGPFTLPNLRRNEAMYLVKWN